MPKSIFRILACLLLSVSFTACGASEDTNNGASNNGNNGNNGGGDCQTRCTTKVTACGVPSDSASLGCQRNICNDSPSEAFVLCVEDEECDTLVNFLTDPDGSLCVEG